MLTKILSASGADVQVASNVAESLELIESFEPQVLISDLGMPGQDGFSLIREVRTLGFSYQRSPAIALTGFARVEDRRRALRAGFQVHMTKPVDPRELTATIATLVGLTGV